MVAPSYSRRFSFWEWTQVALLAANLCWTTLCLGGYLARTSVVTSALTAALLLVHAIGVLVGRDVPPRAMEAAGPNADTSSRETSFRTVSFGIHPAGWLFVPFLVYGAANVLWVTPVQWLGWFDWFGWAQMIVVFWIVLNGVRSRGAQSALWGILMLLGLVAVLLACYQRFARPDWLMLGRAQPTQYAGRASGPFGIPNSLAAFLLLLIPITGALGARKRASPAARIFFGWLGVIFVFGLGLTISRGAWLGLVAALAAWPLLASRETWRRRLALSASIVCAAVLVGTVLYTVSPRTRERVTQLAHEAGEHSRPILWRAAWSIFCHHPLQGSGAGSYDALFEHYRPEGFVHRPIWAHNDYLNTLSDYGAVGFVLFFGAAAGVAITSLLRLRRLLVEEDGEGRLSERTGNAYESSSFRIRGRTQSDPLRDPFVQQASAIGLLAFGFQLFVDFHFKIPALAMTFATVAGLSTGSLWGRVSGRGETRRTMRVVVGVAMLAGGIAILRIAVPAYRAEALRDQARSSIDDLANEPTTSAHYRDRIQAAKADLARASLIAPGDGNVWADHAYALAQWSRVVPEQAVELGREAEADANRAIALAPVFAEFWIRRGVARDMQHRRLEAAADFTHAISLSPKAPYPWYYYAYHLSLDRGDRDMALAMVDFCLRLDPKNQEAVRLRQRLAVSQVRP